MPRISAHRPTTAKALVDSLLENRDLSTIVQQLNPATLHHLVAELGIEDSAPLVAHASTRQIAGLLDSTLWTGSRPGNPETMSMETLMRWFDLWADMGDEAAAEVLHDLGDAFCTLAFSRLIAVSEDPAGLDDADEQTQIVGTYRVRARYADEWPSLQQALNALWAEYPDYLESILERLVFRHSILRMEGEMDALRILRIDAEHEREQSRESAGYVTSAMAGAYLRAVMVADLDTLADETDYDPETSAYFLRRAFSAQPTATAAAESPEQTADIPPENKPTHQALFQAELAAYERAHSRSTLLLEGPAMSDLLQRQPVRAAIARLQDRPEVFGSRMDELAYLANLLLAGIELDGRRLTETEAANLSMATCNLGGSYLHWLEASNDPAEFAIASWIEAEPGLIRLFRVGWHLIAQLPLQVAHQLASQLRAETVRARFEGKAWLLAEVDALLGQPDFVDIVRSKNFDEAKETLRILGIVLTPETVTILCHLTDSVPRFARVLEEHGSQNSVATEARFIESFDDVALIQDFLRTLAERLKF